MTSKENPIGQAGMNSGWDLEANRAAPACDLADSGRAAVLSWSHLVV